MNDTELAHKIVSYSRECIGDSLRRFGHWRIPEAYVQAYCAMRLMSEDRLAVMLEVTPYDLTEVAKVSQLVIDPVGNFKLDLIVFEDVADSKRPCVRAIVEFKRDANPDKLAKDIKRIWHVLSAIPATGMDIAPIGIQILFTVNDKESDGSGSRAALETAIVRSGIICSKPWPESGKPDKAHDKNLWHTAAATIISRLDQQQLFK